MWRIASSNPEQWQKDVGRPFDILDVPSDHPLVDDEGGWSVSCGYSPTNEYPIEGGDVIFINRAGLNVVAGLLLVEDAPFQQEEPLHADGYIWIAPGMLIGLPEEWHISAATLRAEGFQGKPWGIGGAFRNGERIVEDDRKALGRSLPFFVGQTIATHETRHALAFA
jgi:hypothetical protein